MGKRSTQMAAYRIEIMFTFLTAQLYVNFVSFANGARKVNGGTKIVGGQIADRDQFPYQIYIYNNERYTFCGGSIISPSHVLTAAHCQRNKDGDGTAALDKIDVYAGVYNISDLTNSNVQKIPIKAVYNHPRWDIHEGSYEIAIFKMTDNFKLNEFVKPIRYAKRKDSDDLYAEEKVVASGWGSTTSFDNPNYPDILMWNEQEVEACTFRWGEDNFCAKGETNQTTCGGDSGGPIVCKDLCGKDYLCGFSSGGFCGTGPDDDAQSIFGRINFYTSFINETLAIP